MASGNPNDPAGGAESPAALLPLNAFGGKTPKVGDTCSFRVVQVYDDQVEVEYAHAEGGQESEPEEGEMTGYLS